jgi:hypothetical protein
MQLLILQQLATFNTPRFDPRNSTKDSGESRLPLPVNWVTGWWPTGRIAGSAAAELRRLFRRQFRVLCRFRRIVSPTSLTEGAEKLGTLISKPGTRNRELDELIRE